jgi:hypothetical protein
MSQLATMATSIRAFEDSEYYRNFVLKISEEAEPWEISKLQAPDPEWKTEKANLLTFPFRMCSLQSFSDVGQKSID